MKDDNAASVKVLYQQKVEKEGLQGKDTLILDENED